MLNLLLILQTIHQCNCIFLRFQHFKIKTCIRIRIRINSNKSKAKIFYRLMSYWVVFIVRMTIFISFYYQFMSKKTQSNEVRWFGNFVLSYLIFFCKYFHYCAYHFDFYSNWLITFSTKIVSKIICFYHTLSNVTNFL